MANTNRKPKTPPATIEVGQMWMDTDPRSKGTGEFTIVAVIEPGKDPQVGSAGALNNALASMVPLAAKAARDQDRGFVIVKREHSLSRIRTARLAKHYAYLGRGR